jgi:hypothetical protein
MGLTLKERIDGFTCNPEALTKCFGCGSDLADWELVQDTYRGNVKTDWYECQKCLAQWFNYYVDGRFDRQKFILSPDAKKLVSMGRSKIAKQKERVRQSYADRGLLGRTDWMVRDHRPGDGRSEYPWSDEMVRRCGVKIK